MNKQIFFPILCSIGILVSCKSKVNASENMQSPADPVVPLVEKVLSAEEQAKLTPDTVIQLLKNGNKEFTEDALVVRNTTQRVRNAVAGQFPKAVILSCMDSRIPVEDVFNKGLGSLFVLRVAGNIVNQDMLGSMEYGCQVSGAKLIVVLGHEYCGAIKAAIDHAETGNIGILVAKIRPAAEAVKNFEGNRDSKNNLFVHRVCEENVRLAIAAIRNGSPVLQTMEQKGQIKIIGAVYNMQTGVVDFEQN